MSAASVAIKYGACWSSAGCTDIATVVSGNSNRKTLKPLLTDAVSGFKRRARESNTPRKHGKFDQFQRRRCKFRCSCRSSGSAGRSRPHHRRLADASRTHSPCHFGTAGLRAVMLALVDCRSRPLHQRLAESPVRQISLAKRISRPRAHRQNLRPRSSL